MLYSGRLIAATEVERMVVQSLRVLATAFAATLLISSTTASCDSEMNTQASEWTILIYLDGDNDLDIYSEMDIEEMMSVGSTDKVRVLVLWDRFDLPVYLYEVHSEGLEVIPGLTVNGIDLNGEEVHMGNPLILEAFVDFGTDMYPSEHLMVILWDHGDPLYGVCWDDHWKPPWRPSPPLSYENIGGSILGHDVDVLAFDSCSAGMADIAYLYGQMNACEGLGLGYMVASEIYVPVYGFPYDRMLQQMNLVADDSEVSEVACMIVEEYADSYAAGSPGNGGNTASLSAIDPSALFTSVSVIEDLTELLRTRLEADYEKYVALISDARGDANLIWGVPSSWGFIDFPEFVNGLTRTPSDKELRLSAETVLSMLQTDVILCVGNAEAAESGGANGLGIWFPRLWDPWPEFYLQYFFDFVEDSGWIEFLHAYWSA